MEPANTLVKCMTSIDISQEPSGLALCMATRLPSGALFCVKLPFTIPCIRSAVGAQPPEIRRCATPAPIPVDERHNSMGERIKSAATLLARMALSPWLVEAA